MNAAHAVSIGPVHFTRTFLAPDKDFLLRASYLEDAVVLFLMLHYTFRLEYPAYYKCTCKVFQQHVLKRSAAEDGLVPVKFIRFMDKPDY